MMMTGVLYDAIFELNLFTHIAFNFVKAPVLKGQRLIKCNILEFYKVLILLHFLSKKIFIKVKWPKTMKTVPREYQKSLNFLAKYNSH